MTAFFLFTKSNVRSTNLITPNKLNTTNVWISILLFGPKLSRKFSAKILVMDRHFKSLILLQNELSKK